MTVIPKAEDILQNFKSLKSIPVEIMRGNKPHYRKTFLYYSS